jgi:hypothetical protein
MTARKSTNIPPPPQWLFVAILVAFFLLSISTCHAGWRTRASQEKMLPPAEYVYTGEYVVLRIAVEQITVICHNALKKSGQRAVGCSFKQQVKCIILIAIDHDLELTGWDYDIVLQHELGHCAGWQHDY